MKQPQDKGHDSLFDGQLICEQHLRGYRFSIDAVLLAHFVPIDKGDRILDLGCGNGVVSLILLYRWQGRIAGLTGMELQPQLASLAEKNMAANNFSDICRIVCDDVRKPLRTAAAESFDKIVCNPPFFQQGRGRQSQNEEARIARHLVRGQLADFLRSAAYFMKNKGEAFFIFPASGLDVLLQCAGDNNLQLHYMRPIYSYPDNERAARLVLLSLRKNGGKGMKIGAPHYIYQYKNGPYSKETSRLYEAGRCDHCLL